MRLLFDQNLSPHLVRYLNDIYPNSTHVYMVQLDRAADLTVWEYARQHGYAIVSRDVDFSELSILRGSPPKIIWIRRGNCSTSDIELMLRLSKDAIEALESDQIIGIIELF